MRSNAAIKSMLQLNQDVYEMELYRISHISITCILSSTFSFTTNTSTHNNKNAGIVVFVTMYI